MISIALKVINKDIYMANLNNIIVILVITELESIEYTTSVSIIVYGDFIFKMVLELLDNKGDTNRDIQSL